MDMYDLDLDCKPFTSVATPEDVTKLLYTQLKDADNMTLYASRPYGDGGYVVVLYGYKYEKGGRLSVYVKTMSEAKRIVADIKLMLLENTELVLDRNSFTVVRLEQHTPRVKWAPKEPTYTPEPPRFSPTAPY